jgi:hypothetical protein
MSRYIPIPVASVEMIEQKNINVIPFNFTYYADDDEDSYEDYGFEFDDNIPIYLQNFIRERGRAAYGRMIGFEEHEFDSETDFVAFFDMEIEQKDDFDYEGTYVSVTGKIYTILL